MGGGDLFIKRRIFERVISRYVFLDPCIIRKCINETRETKKEVLSTDLFYFSIERKRETCAGQLIDPGAVAKGRKVARHFYGTSRARRMSVCAHA